MGCNCYDDCCPVSGQLCVDASFFVPEQNDCTVQGLYFCDPLYYTYLTIGELTSSVVVTAPGQVITKNVPVGWTGCDAPSTQIGELVTSWTVNAECTYLYLTDLSLANVTDCTSVVPAYYIGECAPSSVNFSGNLSIGGKDFDTLGQIKQANLSLAGKNIGNLIVLPVAPVAVDATNPCCKTAILLATLTVSCSPTDLEVGGFFATGKINDNKYYVAEKIAAAKGGAFAAGDQAPRIGEACLCLQLRANKNVLNNDLLSENPDSAYFPAGEYEICVTHKDCDGNFKNLSVAKVQITRDPDTVVCAYWGKHTDKKCKKLAVNHDCALLNGCAKVVTCGNVQDVADNRNDFALCIENIMQAFDNIDTIIVGTQEGKVVPSDCLQLVNSKTIKADLANSKLYVSIKYVAVCPPPPGLPPVPTPVSCCPGTLNPFAPGCNSNVNGSSCPVYKTKGFCTCEIATMQDHPLRGSNLSRDVTCCLTTEDIDKFRAAETD